MVDTLRYKDWLEKALRDIKSAKILTYYFFEYASKKKRREI